MRKYNAESTKQGRKRFNSIVKTINFYYLPIIYLWLPAISWFAAAALGPQGRGQPTQADPPAAAATATAEASAPAASATYGCASWLTTRQAHIRALQRVCASRSVGEF